MQRYAQRNQIMILVKSIEIWLYLAFSDRCWNQTEYRYVQKQSENYKYNQFSEL